MGARLFPERKVRAFLDALVHKEHIPVSGIERTHGDEYRVLVLGKPVIIAVRHHGEQGIKEPYVHQIIDAAAEKYGSPGTPKYDTGRKEIKKLARKIIGF